MMAFVLYIRGHAKRLPLTILIPHLIRKSGLAISNWFKKPDKEQEPLF